MTEQTLQRLSNGKSLGGRPDKIDGRHVKLANKYIDGAWKADGSVVPTAEAMAEYLDISRKTLYEVEELSDTLERLQRIQSSMVINKGLTGEFNANIAKLILSAKHGYVERSSVENTHEMVAPQAPQVAEDFQAYVNNKTLTDGTKAQD